MNESIGVSIICNAYNHEKYIRDALNGFVIQKTSFPIEVLVHDDASTDHTAEIIREYERNYPELIKPIYETENQYKKKNGTIKRLQAERAKGKYIAFCEGDDYWTDPLKLQKQYDFMEANPEYTLCGCSTEWLNMLTGKVEKRCVTEKDKDVSLETLLSTNDGRIFTTVSYFMKPEIWKELPAWGFPVGDLPMTYFAAMQGKVRMLADSMCVYRWYSEGSWTMRQSRSGERVETHLKMVAALERMNQSTGYQYDEMIQRRILIHRYSAAKLNHNFKALRSGELGEMYRKRSFAHRLMDRLCCQAPSVYLFLERMAGRTQTRVFDKR